MMGMKKIGLSLLLLLSVASGYGQRTYDEFFLEAMMQRQKGNNDAAFDLLRHCLEINPEAPEAYFFLAQYYNALKDADKSLAYIQKAAELDPDNDTYMETLAQAYIRQQDYEAAIPVVEGIYARDKEREDLLEMLFQLYQQVGDLASAVQVLNRIEAIDGKSERVYRIPLQAQLADGISLMQLLATYKSFNPEDFCLDLHARANVAGKIGKDIDYKDVPLTKFLKK
jgi:tetratricopeptide (TPR) repeat protein